MRGSGRRVLQTDTRKHLDLNYELASAACMRRSMQRGFDKLKKAREANTGINLLSIIHRGS